MKIIILLGFLSGLAQSTHPRDNCWLQCDPKDYKALVTCSSIPDNVDPCACENGSHDLCEDATVNGKTGPMTWNECHDLAKLVGAEGAALENKFFRWENKETEKQTHCYLIPKVLPEGPEGPECIPLPPGDCYPYDDSPCVAGRSDLECEPVATVLCDAPVWEDEGFHWTCVGPSGDVLNAYTLTGEKIPMGTTCDTGKIECSTWEWEDGQDHDDVAKKAFVECGETAPDSGTGTWKSNPEDNLLVDKPLGEDGLPIETIQIIPPQDGVCRCPLLDITLDTYNTPGLSLLCDQAYNPADLGIKYGNSCTLLCDGHFKMYIECIKGQWKNTGAGYPFADVSSTDINC